MPRFEVGDHVQARWRGGQFFTNAIIHCVHPEEGSFVYSVQYADGLVEDNVQERLVRARASTTRAATSVTEEELIQFLTSCLIEAPCTLADLAMRLSASFEKTPSQLLRAISTDAVNLRQFISDRTDKFIVDGNLVYRQLSEQERGHGGDEEEDDNASLSNVHPNLDDDQKMEEDEEEREEEEERGDGGSEHELAAEDDSEDGRDGGELLRAYTQDCFERALQIAVPEYDGLLLDVARQQLEFKFHPFIMMKLTEHQRIEEEFSFAKTRVEVTKKVVKIMKAAKVKRLVEETAMFHLIKIIGAPVLECLDEMRTQGTKSCTLQKLCDEFVLHTGYAVEQWSTNLCTSIGKFGNSFFEHVFWFARIDKYVSWDDLPGLRDDNDPSGTVRMSSLTEENDGQLSIISDDSSRTADLTGSAADTPPARQPAERRPLSFRMSSRSFSRRSNSGGIKPQEYVRPDRVLQIQFDKLDGDSADEHRSLFLKDVTANWTLVSNAINTAVSECVQDDTRKETIATNSETLASVHWKCVLSQDERTSLRWELALYGCMVLSLVGITITRITGLRLPFQVLMIAMLLAWMAQRLYFHVRERPKGPTSFSLSFMWTSWQRVETLSKTKLLCLPLATAIALAADYQACDNEGDGDIKTSGDCDQTVLFLFYGLQLLLDLAVLTALVGIDRVPYTRDSIIMICFLMLFLLILWAHSASREFSDIGVSLDGSEVDVSGIEEVALRISNVLLLLSVPDLATMMLKKLARFDLSVHDIAYRMLLHDYTTGYKENPQATAVYIPKVRWVGDRDGHDELADVVHDGGLGGDFEVQTASGHGGDQDLEEGIIPDGSTPIGEELDDEENEPDRRLVQAFLAADTDHSGAIDAGELVGAMRKIGRRDANERVARTWIATFDRDGDGELNLEEYIAFLNGMQIRL